MADAGGLDSGRAAFIGRAWGRGIRPVVGGRCHDAAGPEDLELLTAAAYLVGRDEDAADLSARGYREWLDRDDRPRAARCAFWLAFRLLLKGDVAQSEGWLARAARLVDDTTACVETGYLLVPAALQSMDTGDAAAALSAFTQAVTIGNRHDDPDLTVLGRLGAGQALIQQGKAAEGVPLLDEVMIAVTNDEVSPIVAGLVYCAVIEACHAILDLRRAHEWTAALTRWCDSQPDLVPYRGQCLVHRAEIMQLHGDWQDAMREARLAYQRLSHPPGQPAIGLALYRQAELHRLSGDFRQAEEAYRLASRWSGEPQPGLALLRLAQGRLDVAAAGIRRAIDIAEDGPARTRLLPAYVDIMVAAGDVPAARRGADELRTIAEDVDTPWLQASAEQALGTVLLAEGDGSSALRVLRRAWTTWSTLDVPYDGARTRVVMGLACRSLGDEDGAAMEFDAARWIFQQLGALPDVARAEDLARHTITAPAGGLTRRELEVLRQVASGKSNRAIATELFLSEKTVARHVSNIFTKLGLSSRSAATRYAYEHGLAQPI